MKRILGTGDSCYHVLSRITEKRFYLANKEKKVFREMMQRAAVFSGVDILTFCIMDNHFHILVRVPPREEVPDKELIRRLKVLYRPKEWEALVAQFEGYARENDEGMLQSFREQYLRRMYDLTEFVRTLKQRFSIWYNHNNDRVGPLWDGRFRSVLVQSSGFERGLKALCIMAAYIDLNAVRAGLVNDPQDYAWCGYSEAIKGKKKSIAGLRYVLGRGRAVPCGAEAPLEDYRLLLLSSALGNSDNWSHERVQQLRSRDETLSAGELLRCRVRYFSYGRVLGSCGYVTGIRTSMRDCFCSRQRTHLIEELSDSTLYTGNLPRGKTLLPS